MSGSSVGGRLSARVGGGRARGRCRGGDRGWGRRLDRRFGCWSDDDGAADVRSRGLTVGVGRHNAEDDEANAGYARRCERADGLGYAYGLTASAMGGHGNSWAYVGTREGTRPVPGCLRPTRQPSFPRLAWSTSHFARVLSGAVFRGSPGGRRAAAGYLARRKRRDAWPWLDGPSLERLAQDNDAIIAVVVGINGR
jgi:hypothetical protein